MPKTKKRNIWLVAIVVGVVFVALAAWYLYSTFLVNYAKNEAQPIEKALIKAGAMKKCETGDGGHGPDNFQPWYKGYFEINRTEEEAIRIAKQTASEAGYSLTQATLENRGPVGVADQFISKWYYDNTSKQNPYSQLEEGGILLFMTVNADGTASSCGGRDSLIDETHSVIKVDVSMPGHRGKQ